MANKSHWYRWPRNALCCILLVESAWLVVQWWLTRREEFIYLSFGCFVSAVGFAIEWGREKQAK